MFLLAALSTFCMLDSWSLIGYTTCPHLLFRELPLEDLRVLCCPKVLHFDQVGFTIFFSFFVSAFSVTAKSPRLQMEGCKSIP